MIWIILGIFVLILMLTWIYCLLQISSKWDDDRK